MGEWRVELTKSAERELRRLPKPMQRRFRHAIDRLGANGPVAGPGLDILRLTDRDDTWRLRVGDHRALIGIDERTIVITAIRKRSKGYKR